VTCSQAIKELCTRAKVNTTFLEVHPRQTMSNFNIAPWALGFDPSAKLATGRQPGLLREGVWGDDNAQQAYEHHVTLCLPPDLPPMVTLKNVFKSILKDGFEGNREPLEINFGDNDALGGMMDFSIKYVDGFQRGLSIVACLHYTITLDLTAGDKATILPLCHCPYAMCAIMMRRTGVRYSVYRSAGKELPTCLHCTCVRHILLH
jgi:hypothetical protein